jgi:hypothetical protein
MVKALSLTILTILYRLHQILGQGINNEAQQWVASHIPTREVEQRKRLGSDGYALGLGISIKYSRLWARQDYTDL